MTARRPTAAWTATARWLLDDRRSAPKFDQGLSPPCEVTAWGPERPLPTGLISPVHMMCMNMSRRKLLAF